MACALEKSGGTKQFRIQNPEVVESLKRLGATQIDEWELVREDVSFGLPAELSQ